MEPTGGGFSRPSVVGESIPLIPGGAPNHRRSSSWSFGGGGRGDDGDARATTHDAPLLSVVTDAEEEKTFAKRVLSLGVVATLMLLLGIVGVAAATGGLAPGIDALGAPVQMLINGNEGPATVTRASPFGGEAQLLRRQKEEARKAREVLRDIRAGRRVDIAQPQPSSPVIVPPVITPPETTPTEGVLDVTRDPPTRWPKTEMAAASGDKASSSSRHRRRFTNRGDEYEYDVYETRRGRGGGGRFHTRGLDRGAYRESRLGQAEQGDDGVAGVSLNGWLHLEEWFFSDDKYSLVDSPEDLSQGVVFPPTFTTPDALGFQWASEGDLVAKMHAKHGAEQTVEAFKAHREAYLEQADLDKFAQLGYKRVRLPVTWACFFGNKEAKETIVKDPAHDGIEQVTVSRETLNRYLQKLTAAGVSVIIDLHNMPGGSSRGTYNGVFPREPRFWDDDNLKIIGRGVLREMMRWYVELPEDLKKAVAGFTLLNEPAHLMPEKKEEMLAWYEGAVQDYKNILVAANNAANLPVPKLYVNMIDTSGVDFIQHAALMRNLFTPAELAEWAVIDIHQYLAWEHSGCNDGTCAWRCDAPLDDIRQSVYQMMNNKLSALMDAAAAVGIRHAAVGEWSLATHHESRTGCRSPAVLEAVYDAQTSAMRAAGVSNFFWGWKIPAGGVHRSFWSMEYFQSTIHSPRMSLGASDGTAPAEVPFLEPEPEPAGSMEPQPMEPQPTEPMEAQPETIDAAAAEADAIVEADAAKQEERLEEGTWDGYMTMGVSPSDQSAMKGNVGEMLATRDRAAAEAAAEAAPAEPTPQDAAAQVSPVLADTLLSPEEATAEADRLYGGDELEIPAVQGEDQASPSGSAEKDGMLSPEEAVAEADKLFGGDVREPEVAAVHDEPREERPAEETEQSQEGPVLPGEKALLDSLTDHL